MGIKFLNKFLQENCDQSIWHIHLSELNGKKIAIDISVYLYKYETEDTLIENIYLMLSIFRHYNITPIFIFDGKPPPEKKELLQKRKANKVEAKNEYYKLKELLDTVDTMEKQEIISNMDQLKKQFVFINREKTEKVKNLIQAYGSMYYEAPGEADELCAMLVIKKKVWACLSEDMDLFVYGCNRVLRYISLTNHTVVLYYMKGILNQLNMTQKEFREICVLSGTDYNINANSCIKNNNFTVNLHNTIKYFRKYKEVNTIQSFYDWIINLDKNSDYISDLDLDILYKINNMFEISNELVISFKNIKIINTSIQREKVQEIMKDDGFLFINTLIH